MRTRAILVYCVDLDAENIVQNIAKAYPQLIIDFFIKNDKKLNYYAIVQGQAFDFSSATNDYLLSIFEDAIKKDELVIHLDEYDNIQIFIRSNLE